MFKLTANILTIMNMAKIKLRKLEGRMKSDVSESNTDD